MMKIREGVYTIEAAVILTIVTLLVALMIYAALCLHDRAICLETALFDVRASVQMLEEPVTLTGRLDAERVEMHSIFDRPTLERYVSQTLLEAEFKLKAESRMLLGKLTSVKAAIENGRVTLSYEGSFSFMESGLLGMITSPEKTFCREVSMKKSRGPEEIVRLMKGIIWRE